SAPFTQIGPVTECGPPPSFCLRSSTNFSIGTPGCTWSSECIRVSTEMVSPESTVSLGGSLGSSQPHCTVSGVAANEWCLFVAALDGDPESRFVCAKTSIDEHRINTIRDAIPTACLIVVPLRNIQWKRVRGF